MSTMPNRLRIKGGALHMIDGSDVVEYLRTALATPDGSDVVVMRRDKAEQLLHDAQQWWLHTTIHDERFALCA